MSAIGLATDKGGAGAEQAAANAAAPGEYLYGNIHSEWQLFFLLLSTTAFSSLIPSK
jgi:hypothetical protein